MVPPPIPSSDFAGNTQTSLKYQRETRSPSRLTRKFHCLIARQSTQKGIREYRRRWSGLAIFAMQGCNPGILPSVFVDDLAGGVGGTVVDDDPIPREESFAQDGFNGLANIRFFVANRSDDAI